MCGRIGHGGKEIKKICSHEGCTLQVYRRGVCRRHGAKEVKHGAKEVKKCSSDRHLAAIKKCSSKPIKSAGGDPQEQDAKEDVEGKGDVEVVEGDQQRSKDDTAKCKAPFCNRKAQQGGVCISHGGKGIKKICSQEKCTLQVYRRGVCRRHGAKEPKKCSSKAINSAGGDPGGDTQVGGMNELSLLHKEIKGKLATAKGSNSNEEIFYGHLKRYFGRAMRDDGSLSPAHVAKIKELKERFESYIKDLNDEDNDDDDMRIYQGFIKGITKECESLPRTE